MATLGLSPLTLSILIGLAPSIIWIFFWEHLTHEKREPLGLLIMCFILGGLSVLLAIYLQKYFKDILSEPNTRIVVLAAIEEILKFSVYFLIAHNSSYNKEAIDPAMYLIITALGFAALENIFYILQPIGSFNITASLLTGTFRFFGSTLLHTITSAFIGIMITFTRRKFTFFGIILGIVGAIFLHSTFNFFIIRNDTASFIQIYGYLWIITIITHAILEKIRRYPKQALSTSS